MKLTTLLLIVSLFKIQANSYSQTTRITLDVESVNVMTVLEKIESLSEFKFLGNENVIDNFRLVSIQAKKKRINKILDELFENTGIGYKIIDRQIVLVKNKEIDITLKEIIPKLVSEEIDQQNEITGTIADFAGNPLLGASVVEKGTQNGTQSDFDGNFSMEVADANAVLIISYVGFITQEVQVAGRTNIPIVLQEDTAGLDEVVVVAYGTQKKSDLTGAISSISDKDVRGQPVANINEAILGKIPGVEITATSGEPGSALQIRIRGMGTFGDTGPLYVVDGLPVSVTDVNAIDPNTIASLDILKDASASAIYGSRAANGVVLITTKSGKSGKAQMNFQSYYGIQTFKNFIPMLNSQQYAELNNDASQNAGATPEAAFSNPAGIPVDTDWQEAAYRSAPIQNYTLTVSGGSDDAKYSVSGGYFKQEGIMVSNYFKRFSTRVKTQFKIGDKFTIGETLILSRSLGLNRGQGNNLDFAYLLGASPTMPIYREANLGGYAGPNAAETGRNNRENIVGRRDLRRSYTSGNKILGSMFAEYKILPNLKYRLNLGINAGMNAAKRYIPKFEMENRTNLIQQLMEQKAESYEYLVENILTYDKVFDDFSLSLLGGYTEQSFFSSFILGNIREFPSNDLQVINAGTGSFTLEGTEEEWTLRSYLARANVTLLNKYLFTATFRRDGSSRFGAQNKYGNFPSVALGWNVSRENFMSEITDIDYLKIRGSWGRLGNQEVGGNYVNQTTIATNVRYILGTDQGLAPGAAVTSLGNPALKWETTTQTNIGVDMNLFSSITFSADFWVKDTEGVLLRTPISVASGIARSGGPYENSAGIKNSGFEFLLGYRKSINAFNFEVTGNLSTVKNEITTLGEGSTIINLVRNVYGFGTFTRTSVGESMSSLYGYVADGIFQNSGEVSAHATQPGAAPGDVRFKDLNGDGAITDDDRTVIGNPFPDFSYGVYANASYKDFDMSFSFQGVKGQELYNSQRAFLESMDGQHGQMATTLSRWTGEGTSNSMPRAVRGDPNQNARPSTRFVEDASFLKLKNIQIGYTLPKNLAESIKVASARFYISAQNVFTLTDYSGYDPDVLGGVGFATNELNPLSIGVDTGTYPLPRTIQFGVQVGF